MTRFTALSAAMCLVTAIACGHEDDGHGAATGAGGGHADHASSTTSVTGSTSSASSATSATTGAGGSNAPPQAPNIVSVAPMEGALHVEWENVTPNCDQIELDRKKDDGAYATEYTLTGVATSQHDTEAVPPGTYCYRARCTKGAQTSPDSSETCGTP